MLIRVVTFGCIIAGCLCSIVSVLSCVAACCISVADCQLLNQTKNYYYCYYYYYYYLDRGRRAVVVFEADCSDLRSLAGCRHQRILGQGQRLTPSAAHICSASIYATQTTIIHRHRLSNRSAGMISSRFPGDISRKFSTICSFIDIYRAGSLTRGITLILFTKAIAQLKDIYRGLTAPMSINPGLLQDVLPVPGASILRGLGKQSPTVLKVGG